MFQVGHKIGKDREGLGTAPGRPQAAANSGQRWALIRIPAA